MDICAPRDKDRNNVKRSCRLDN